MEAKLVKQYEIEQLKVFAVCPTHFAHCDETNIILKSLFFSSFDKELDILLHGHHAPISALTFGKSPLEDRILLSAASDYIITWNVLEVLECHQNGKEVRGHILSSTVEAPHSLVHSYNHCLLGAISEHHLIVYDIGTKDVLFNEKVKDLSCLEFTNQKQVITATFGGVVTLWSLEDEKKIIWQNTSSLGFSLTSLSACPVHNRFSVGSSIAIVREYLFCEGAPPVKECQKLDLDESLMRINHQWKQSGSGDESRGHVLAMMYYNQTRDENLELLNDICYLICATERALFSINCYTQEVHFCPYFVEDVGAPVVTEVQFTTSRISGEIFCAVVCMFEPKACVLSINLSHQSADQSLPISLVAKVPLLKSSILKSSIKLTKPKISKQDHPVTFKRRVKSSGYTAGPRMAMFKPRTNASKKYVTSNTNVYGNSATSSTNVSENSATSSCNVSIKHIPSNSNVSEKSATSSTNVSIKPVSSSTNVPEDPENSNSVQPPISFESPVPQPIKFDWSSKVSTSQSVVLSCDVSTVNCISVNDRNRYLACGLNNTTVNVTNLPLSSSKEKFRLITDFTGHNRPVSGCCWSHESNMLMTYTNYGQVKLWTPLINTDAVLTFEAKCPGKILKDLVHGQFYYLDKFILLGLGNSLYMYKYIIQDCVKDDIKRYLNQGHYKMIGEWPMLSAQSVTCVTAPNNMFSYTVLMGGSDRSVEVHDMNVGKRIHRFENAHNRAINAIHHCSGSSLVSEGFSDIFITSAVSDGIKLWDLRTKLCARKFNNHSCATKCSCVISPCGNYIATTTDNKSVCIYDVRRELPVHNIISRDNAISLAFSSLSNQIFVGYDASKIATLQPI